jgi:hypothetical protein
VAQAGEDKAAALYSPSRRESDNRRACRASCERADGDPGRVVVSPLRRSLNKQRYTTAKTGAPDRKIAGAQSSSGVLPALGKALLWLMIWIKTIARRSDQNFGDARVGNLNSRDRD